MVDELLKRKILDKDVDIDSLAEEDRQAILIFLRNTAFGSEYNVSLTDPKTAKEFDATIDISSISVKDFTLIPNQNNEFEYFLPQTKKKITFKFLTPKQEKELDVIRNSATGVQVAPVNTKRLEMMIKSIDGNTDQMAIYQFIQNLPIKDSQDFKRFVADNKPNLDLSFIQLNGTFSNSLLNIKIAILVTSSLLKGCFGITLKFCTAPNISAFSSIGSNTQSVKAVTNSSSVE